MTSSAPRIVTTIIMGIIITSLICPVSAEQYYEDEFIVINDSKIDSIQFSNLDVPWDEDDRRTTAKTMITRIDSIVIDPSIEEIYTYVIAGKIDLIDDTIFSQTLPVTYKYSGNVIGTGSIYYYADADSDNSYILLTSDNWDGSSYYAADKCKVYISLDYDKTKWNLECFHGYTIPNVVPSSRYPSLKYKNLAHLFGARGDYEASLVVGHNNVLNARSIFLHDISSIFDGDNYIISINRKSYNSHITIQSAAKNTPYYNSTSKNDVSFSLPTIDAPYHISVYSYDLDRWYDSTVASNSLDGTDGSVTIHVRNSQTGAYLADSHLQIDVLSGDEYRTVVSRAVTNGTATVELQRTGCYTPNPYNYRAIISADGYSSFGPTLFGVGADPLSLDLWMYPDIDPADPPFDPPASGKTALYGFLVSQGSYQPIPGATVSLGDSSPPTTTSSTGFYLFNDIDPGPYTITASADGHDQLQEQVTAGPIVLQHNMALKGLYALKVTTKDADSLQIISNATTISLNDGQESTDNPATFTVDYGAYTITAAAEGYYPDSEYQYIDKPGTTQATILLTKQVAPPTPPDRPSYPPHNVRFHCINDYGSPISNVTLTAEFVESSSPWSWLTDLLGIPSSVEINSTTLAGTTGTDGSITFNMIETVRYTIHAHDPASNLTVDFSLYPHETQYTIQFHSRPPPATATRPLYELTATPNEDNTKITLGLAYYDRDNGTTALTFWVKDDTDGNITHSSTPDVKLNGWTNATHTVDNLPGSYTWGFNATHNDHDDITASRSITLHGAGRLVDLGLEDDFWYYLLSIIWIIGIAAIFSGSRVRFGAIIIPLIGGGIPTLIGWLPPVTAPLIAILTFIGVFVYMRKSEYKMYR